MTTGDADIKVRIMSAAKKLFAQQGFEKTTVRQICEEAGANVALVSYHFGGKENMFCALFDFYFPNAQIAQVDTLLDPVKGVELVVREVTIFRNSDPELIHIIQQEIIMNTDRIQKIREHAIPIWKHLKTWLEQGREQGVFHFRSIDSTLLSIIGTLLFYRHNSYWNVLNEGEPITIDQMIEDMTVFILNALQCNIK